MYPNDTTQDIPYGLCKCGCGQSTPLAKRTNSRYGHFKGQPLHFINGHYNRTFIIGTPGPNPSGLCMCGCGQKTPIAPYTRKECNWVCGEPIRFVRGHNVQRNPIATEPKYCECGCGQITPISTGTNLKIGRIKGQHARFCLGHRPSSTPEEMFWEHVTPGPFDKCWEWQGHINDSGYGEFRCGNGPLIRAHRTSYEIHHGPIPDGLHVCHHCDNRPCCNPYHLFVGSDADNVHDMDRKGRRVNTPQQGEKHGMSKLTPTDILAIRELATQGITPTEIGRRFGISDTHAGRIIKRQCWAHLP